MLESARPSATATARLIAPGGEERVAHEPDRRRHLGQVALGDDDARHLAAVVERHRERQVVVLDLGLGRAAEHRVDGKRAARSASRTASRCRRGSRAPRRSRRPGRGRRRARVRRWSARAAAKARRDTATARSRRVSAAFFAYVRVHLVAGLDLVLAQGTAEPVARPLGGLPQRGRALVAQPRLQRSERDRGGDDQRDGTRQHEGEQQPPSQAPQCGPDHASRKR